MSIKHIYSLKIARISAGLTQRDAAKLLGISNSRLSKVETGAASTNLKELIKMSELYRTNIDNLLVIKRIRD